MTTGDVDRVRAHAGHEDFWSLRVPEDSSYLEPDPDDPNWLRYTIDERGRRRMLLRKNNGDCVFLGAGGCVLPMEVRPIVCRLYPFGYNERGLSGVEQHYCPTDVLIPKDRPGVTMLTVLGMVPADGERWRAMLYDELRRDKEAACASG